MNYRSPEFMLFLTITALLLFIIYRLSKKSEIERQKTEEVYKSKVVTLQSKEIERQKAEEAYENKVATLQSKEIELIRQKKRLEAELGNNQSILAYTRKDLYECTAKLKQAEAKAKKMEEDAIKAEKELSEHKRNLAKLLQSNLTAMPWLAGMIADFLTYDLEVEARKLAWGRNIQRQAKVASIRELRSQASQKIAEAKEAIYQLEYLRALFPGIDDILVSDYKDLELDGKPLIDHDPTLDYLSKEEWQKLSEIERNQLALDRYVASRKSKWQIGRDYELSVAHEYMSAGFQVDTFGSYMGLKDLGRDLIAKKGTLTYIIQCKYWSQSKEIHEKHLYQLYGTLVGYCIENNISRKNRKQVQGVFVTNIKLSEMARKVAEDLNLHVYENRGMADFPRIKCNIGKDEAGNPTKIFHLPMDLQYDATKIDKPGEFYAFTVQEAVDAGFRRAFKWRGSKS